MRKLESREINGKMKRSWKLQLLDLMTMKELELNLPGSLKTDLELNKDKNVETFFKYQDSESMEFINNQHWMIDEIDVVDMNLFEINKALNYLIDQRDIIIDSIGRTGTVDGIIDIQVDLILNRYKYECFKYLKQQKEQELKSKRK